MPTSNPQRWAVLIGVLLAIAAIVMVALAGIISTRTTIHKLDRAAAKADCVRAINAEVTENFQHDIGRILTSYASGNLAAAHAAAARIENAPNVADLVEQQCP